jgi:flavin-dependent dehydrogenase
MIDVLVAGAGPAGTVAALLFARAGARVLIVDRERFPRDVVCAGFVSAAALAHLASLDVADEGPLVRAPAIHDASVATTRTRLSVRDVEPRGRAVARRDLDAWLLDRAVHAGAHFEPGVTVAAPLLDSAHRRGLVRGAVLRSSAGTETRMPATLVIAADGARSTLAGAVGLGGVASRSRWAAAAETARACDAPARLDVYVRSGWRLVVTPLADGRRACALLASRDLTSAAPIDAMRSIVAADDRLARELPDTAFDAARTIAYPRVRTRAAGVPGLLLVGDAAGVGARSWLDGVGRAIVSAQLAVTHGLRVLETGDFEGMLGRYADDRRRAFGRATAADWCSRALASTPGTIDVAAVAARVAPAIARSVVRGVLRG